MYFAGEATCRKYPATMHGALLSGMDTAANLHATFREMRIGTYAAGRGAVDMETETAARVPAVAAATAQGNGALQNTRMEESPEALIQRMFTFSSHISNQEAGPDVDLGSFKVIFGPPSTPFEESALMQVKVPSLQKAIHATVYLLMKKELAKQIVHLPHDTDRLKLMTDSKAQYTKFILEVDEKVPDTAVEFIKGVVLYRKKNPDWKEKRDAAPAAVASPSGLQQQQSPTGLSVLFSMTNPNKPKRKIFKLQSHAKMKKLFAKYATFVGKERSSLKFLLGDKVLEDTDTPKSLGLAGREEEHGEQDPVKLQVLYL